MNKSILIVEDDLDDISILQEGFNEIDFKNVLFYNESLSAIKYLNSIDDELLPNLIVTDYNLPAFNGLELVKFLKRHTRFSKIPIVVLSTSMSKSDRVNFLKEGAVKIYIKPSSYNEFKEISEIFKSMAEEI